jgi:hypothetical protein
MFGEPKSSCSASRGIGTNEIMRRTGKSTTCVQRWQERFTDEGIFGRFRDKTRPSRIDPLGNAMAERIVALGQYLAFIHAYTLDAYTRVTPIPRQGSNPSFPLCTGAS